VDFLVDVTGDTSPWFPGSLVADPSNSWASAYRWSSDAR